MAKNIILIADQREENREALKKILYGRYELLEACRTQEVLELLHQYKERLAAVIIDLAGGHSLDGYAVLKQWHQDETLCEIPVVSTAEQENMQKEADSMELGAWDHLRRPYMDTVVRLRVEHVIEHCALRILKRKKYKQEYDDLTGIYNKRTFLKKTKEMLRSCPQETFAFVHFDIHQFYLVNQF